MKPKFEEVVIPKEYLKQLQLDSFFLSLLKEQGVESWDKYGIAVQELTESK